MTAARAKVNVARPGQRTLVLSFLMSAARAEAIAGLSFDTLMILENQSKRGAKISIVPIHDKAGPYAAID
ncbi:MAG: hypothetical protein WBA92_08485 [Pseudorhodobacter sp.]